MRSVLSRLFRRLPPVRRLVEENQRLQAELAASNAQLRKLEQNVADLSAQVTQIESVLAEYRKRESPFPPGHFYSPIIDPSDEWVQRAMEREAQPSETAAELGIDEAEMLRWFDKIAQHYTSNPFPEQPTPGRLYHYANSNFPLADALALLGFMVEVRPRRLVEVGAGYSSCAAIDINEQYLGGNTQLTFIEPYPETALSLFGDNEKYRERLLQQRLQDAPLSIFTELEAGDILFIDSSHVAKTGSDVPDYLFRILPRLQPGVIVHIHDIFYPFEYPREWIEQLGRSWNEAYLVRAFLHGNPAFRVLYMSAWVYKCRPDLLEWQMPLCIKHGGGSLWLQVVGS
jgi:hypothetical protein